MTIKKISPEEEDDLGFRKIIDAKDVEISRLRGELDLSQNAVCDQIEYAYKRLIELADAAASYLSFDGSDKIYDAVKLQGSRVKLRAEIQSAREATR